MTTTGTTGPPAAGAAAAGPTGSGPAAGPGGAAASAEPDGFGVPVEPGGLKPTVGSGGSRMAAGADWSPVTGVPPELLALAERCLQADGGMPLATDPGFLARRWAAPGVVAFALRGDDGALLAAGAARPAGDGAVFTGLVDPAARSRGLGARLLDQGLAAAADLSPAGHNATPRPIITVETESLTADADALFASRGLRQTLAEHVQRIDLITPRPPAPPRPPGATITTWSAATAHRFHTTYAAAF